MSTLFPIVEHYILRKEKFMNLEQGGLFVSDKSAFSSVVSCLRARNSRDVWERMDVPETGTLYFPGRCHVQGRAGEARNHATWIRKSRYARFRASSARDVDEDALETLTGENNSNSDQSPAGDLRVYHRFSFICVLP